MNQNEITGNRGSATRSSASVKVGGGLWLACLPACSGALALEGVREMRRLITN